MHTPQSGSSITTNIIEAGSVAAGPVLGTVAALHELDAQGWISAPWAQEIPGAEHSSSMVGSFGVGLLTSAAAERIALRLIDQGHENAAGKIRRAGKIVAWAGSVICQLAIETNGRMGVSDKWDVIAGIATTAPGIIAGRLGAEHRNPSQTSNANV